jgi:hypothetical protein
MRWVGDEVDGDEVGVPHLKEMLLKYIKKEFSQF